MISRFFRFLFNPYFWVFIGIFAVVLLVWFAGPLFAFADWRPLASVAVRCWVIGIFVGYFLLKLIFGLLRKRNINAKLLEAMTKLKPSDSGDSNNVNVSELQKNFNKALSLLKKSTFNSESGFFSKINRKYVYQLPWYVFIGAPGSGKTTALVNSGLKFPLVDMLGKESVKGVGGTRNCDWWFTEDTVFLDTAGRYTTQDSDASTDKEEWLDFINLLRKFRPKQPLNGAIVTVSITDLLTQDEHLREHHASQLRARLSELSDNLGVNFPVYVLITKADLLGGFSDYFSGLNKEDREQVWGFTLPVASEPSNVEAALPEQIAHELAALSKRLFSGLPDAMLREHDMARRAHAYAFPQNFSNLLPLVNQIIGQIFYGKVLASINFRGVYFVSGTQEGTPFDRVLGALGRRLGANSSLNINTNPQTSSGKSYFIKDLVNRVIFPEAHMAGRNKKEERKELLFGVAGHGIVASCFILLCILWAASYFKNLAYVDFVDKKNNAVAQEFSNLAAQKGTGVLEYLPALSELLVLADGNGFAVMDPPLGVGLGLYQGEKLNSAAQYTYRKALERTLLPGVSRRLEFLLRSSDEHDLGLSYESLKAYLMLADPVHYDANFLFAFVNKDFQEHLPSGVSRDVRESLSLHLQHLLLDKIISSPYPFDLGLVQEKRQLLSRSSFAERAYSHLKASLLQKNTGGFSFSEAGGPKSAFVFRRNSGQPLGLTIPDLFTYHGYHKRFLPALSELVGSMSTEDGWVLGAYSAFENTNLKVASLANAERAVKRLYLHEYVILWEDYLSDLRLVETHSMAETIEVARILSAVDSPLIQLLQAAARELNLGNSFSADATSVMSSAVKRAGTVVSNMERNIGALANELGHDDEVLERIVDDRFKAIIQLVQGQGGASSTDAILKMFNEVYINLSNTDYSIRSGSTALGQTDAISLIRSEAARLPSPVRPILEGLTQEGSRQAEGGIRNTLSSELDNSIGDFCRVAIRGRYPFDHSSTRDVTLADFSRMFAPAGMMDQFFSKHLKSMTDMTGRSWVLRATNENSISIGSFQQAARIRDVFFPSGARSPELSFEFIVIEMDAAINQLTLDFDGQVFQYAHGPQISRTVVWPGPRGSNQIRLELNGVDVSRNSLQVSGPWALLRLFENSEARKRIEPEKFVATVLVHGYRVVFEVTASSVHNPFYLAELTQFSCPKRL